MFHNSDMRVFLRSNDVSSDLGYWIDFLEDLNRFPDETELWQKLKSPEYDGISLANSFQAIVIDELKDVFQGIKEFEVEINGLATSITIAGVLNPNSEDLDRLHDNLSWAKEYYWPSP